MAEAAATSIEPGEGLPARPRMRWLKRAIRKQPIGFAAALVIAVMLLAGVAASTFATHDPLRPSRERLLSPSADHFLGTDELGRDVYSRIVWGARTSMVTGISVTLLSCTVALVIGGGAAYVGGKTDFALQFFLDSLMTIPGIAVALVVVVMIGPHTWENVPITVIVAATIVTIAPASRIARSACFAVKNQQFIESARCIGGRERYIWARHVVPNLLPAMLVVASVELGSVILLEASLSFLGAGTPPPTPSWGAMLSGSGRTFMQRAPWLALAPGLAISLAVLSFNFLGDSLRDLLDPRIRDR